MTRGVATLRLYLIRPSRYDDDGYVVRHFRGVLPSNTLMVLAGLTDDAARRGLLGPSVRVDVRLLDETVMRLPIERMRRAAGDRDVKTVVALAGVQTNQFARAADLALAFRHAGLTVLLGGFHVSGTLALQATVPKDIQGLMDAGVTIVKGEVEETWADLLKDAIAGELKPLYDFLDRRPDLSASPPPLAHKSYLRRFVARNFATLDCGRGCPFSCSFCTIVNVQGRRMRSRSAERITDAVRRNYREQGVSFHFFTDDDFARNKSWESIFDGLIRLREEERIPVQFMMQVDALSHRIPRFVEKARRAGCTNVFIGIESLNPENLRSAGKAHNHVEEYRDLLDTYRRHEIATHASYIVGFPHDDPESVRRDVATLIQSIGPDHASFFMLTPLPGSMDHLELAHRGEWLHPDPNAYDAEHAAMRHPRMGDDEWRAAYVDAWRQFYSFENMKAVLKRAPRCNYWSNLLRHLWYKSSIETEGRHPMMCGLLRMKSRRERRPGLPVPSRLAFLRMRVRELARDLARMARTLLEMEELWLQTRHPTGAERRIAEEYARLVKGGRLRLADARLAYLRARSHIPTLRIPSRMQLFWAKYCPVLAPGRVFTRRDLDHFWGDVVQKVRNRRFLAIAPHRLAMSALREAQIAILFYVHAVRTA